VTLLSMTRGDTATFTLTLTDAAGGPLDLTDLDITFTAKRSTYDADADAVLRKTVGSGITVADDPATGVATLTITAADTADLSQSKSLPWDVEVVDGEDVRTPLSGRLVISRDVTSGA
jgi:hypothetical protein